MKVLGTLGEGILALALAIVYIVFGGIYFLFGLLSGVLRARTPVSFWRAY